MSEMKKENRYVKNGLKWCRKAVGTVLAAGAIMLLSVFSTAAVNVSAETVENTTDYYQSVEKANLEKQIDDFTKFYGSYMENYKKSAAGIGAETTIKAEFDPSIAAALGLKNLKSLKTTIVSMQTDKKSDSLISLFTNDTELTSLNVLTDLEKEVSYIMIPELSKAYLKVSTNPAASNPYGSAAPFTSKDVMEFLNNNPLSESILNQLLKRYTAAAVGEIKDVSAMDYFTTAGGISDDQTRFTVKIDEKTLLAIADKVLTTAKTDLILQDLLVKLKVCTVAEYNAIIDSAIDAVASEKDMVSQYGNEELFVMRVWADSEGNITGRDFSGNTDSDISVFGYKTIKDGLDTGIEAWFNPSGKETLKLSGKVSKDKDNGAVNGDLAVTYSDSYAGSAQKFDVILQDVKSTYKDSTSYINGKFIVTGESLVGQSIIVDFSGNDTEQKIEVDLVQGTARLAAVTINTRILPYEDFDLPSDSDKVYDMETQVEDYLKDTDFESYLEEINKKVDVEGINTVLEQLLYAYRLD